jgi:hypothetical protein
MAGAAMAAGGGRRWRLSDVRWLVYVCVAVSLQCVCVGDEVRLALPFLPPRLAEGAVRVFQSSVLTVGLAGSRTRGRSKGWGC